MVTDDTRTKLRKLAAEACEASGLKLGWIELKRKGNGWLFRVFVDRPDGAVGLSDCERVTQTLTVRLDVEDPFDSSYTLEVSTPGLDRPLHGREDYERFSGKLATLKTTDLIENRRHFVGRLRGVEREQLLIELEVPSSKASARSDRSSADLGTAKLLRIPLSSIESARLEIDPDELGGGGFHGDPRSTGGQA